MQNNSKKAAKTPKAKNSSFTGQPYGQRVLQVFQALDEASSQGATTYPALIDFVRQSTGKGCSPNLVSKWKKERQTTVREQEAPLQEALLQEAPKQEVLSFALTKYERAQTKPSTAQETRTKKPTYLSKLTTAAALCLGLVLGGPLSDGISTVFGKVIARADARLPLTTQHLTPRTTPSDQPKRLVFNLSLSSPKDLKVKEGDHVQAGQVVAERVDEQAILIAQRRTLHLEYQQIKDKIIPTPTPPVKVPALNRLPPISYDEEEAAIASAALNIRQLERAYQLQQQSLKTPPLEEAAAVKRAAVEVQNQLHIVDNQRRKIDAVAMLKDLPEEVGPHEAEVLKQKQAKLQQVQADYEQAQAKLSAAQNAATEKLQQLGAALEQARADHTVAIAKLQTKKDQRAYTEYEASVTAARRAEEQNQATQSYSRALQQALQQQRDRSFQLAQIQSRIAELDDKIRNLSVVTSPYTGVVRKIKIMRQNDLELSCELTLDIAGGTSTPKHSPDESAPTPTPAEPNIRHNSAITKL